MNHLSDNMILIDGRLPDHRIAKCDFDERRRKYHITFCSSDKVYDYSQRRITLLTHPVTIPSRHCMVNHRGRALQQICNIWEYRHAGSRFWRVEFANGEVAEYDRAALEVRESCLQDSSSSLILRYFERVAAHSPLRGDDNTPLLSKQYDHLRFIDRQSAAACYLNPTLSPPLQRQHDTLIYPFGSNASQKRAVEQAFACQLSVIEGPPGTGKTQTILNIIANILCKGQTVLVVSNSNSAIGNIAERLEQRHYGFLVAELGSAANREQFLKMQAFDKIYPHCMFKSWKNSEADKPNYLSRLDRLTQKLCLLFEKQEELFHARQEYDALKLEQRHFREEVHHPLPSLRSHSSSLRLVRLWQELQRYGEEPKVWAGKRWWRTLMTDWCAVTIFGVNARRFLQLDAQERITLLQERYYGARMAELGRQISALEQLIERSDGDEMLEYLYTLSGIYLNNRLYERYGGHRVKPFFTETMIRQNPDGFLQEFPVVLSTTFSSYGNFGHRILFDYVIMDEASQVSSETGVLALACARNAVIVGDSMQLPNVVTAEDRLSLGNLAREMQLSEAYDCTRYSFLDSLCRTVDGVPRTLLKEHYRCHPKIIAFCNQKFYGGQLMYMTEDKGEENVMTAIRTVRGNHSRDHMNQREVDVIREEVLPQLKVSPDQIGIIAPYNHQVDRLRRQLGEVADIATVHKFQGREKDTVILSTVDDVVTPFSDDAQLLNVAVSRAKRRFCLVVSGNPQPQESNLGDLLGYIEYNNFTVSDSRLRSIFDYLYQPYTVALQKFLRRHRHISQYASEDLTFALLEEILSSSPRYRHLGIVCHQSLRLLIGDFSLMTPDEKRYAAHVTTHVDFLIYNRVSKKAVLAVETDGYDYHKDGSRQAVRDAMKDDILTKYGIPFLRLPTTGCNERQRIESKLEELVGRCDTCFCKAAPVQKPNIANFVENFTD